MSPVEIPNVVQDTYKLSRMAHHSHEQALEAAVKAGLKDAEKQVIERVVTGIREYRADLRQSAKEDTDPEDLQRYEEALGWLEDRLSKDLPVRTRTGLYEPADGDYVEVHVRGNVTIEADPCAQCGHTDQVTWWVEDDAGEMHEFSLNSNVIVRRIASAHRAEDVTAA